MTKTTNITRAQVFCLRRIWSDTRYLLRGDRKHALEVRYFMRKRADVRDRSIPVLFRLGLVEFVSEPRESTTYYAVRITVKGNEIRRQYQDMDLK